MLQINRQTNPFGRLKDTPDPRDLMGSPIPKFKITQPIDLTVKWPYIFNQDPLGTCYAFTAMEVFCYDEVVRKGMPFNQKSALFIAYQTSVKQNTVGQDAGGTERDAFWTMAHSGVCTEKLWPYNPDNLGTQPSVNAYAEALQYKILVYRRLLDVNQMKACLAVGLPVALGMPVFGNFPMNSSTGQIPLPKFWDRPVAGHAVGVFGYEPASDYFKFPNTWGMDWGDRGYGYLPGKFISRYATLCDMWQVSVVTG